MVGPLSVARILPALVLIATLLLPALGAQDAAVGPEGSVYFTNKLVADPGGTSPKVFEATPDPPTEEASKKAYTAPGTGAAAFETQFTWKATRAFQLSGPVVAHLWVSCDVATAYRADPAGALGTARFTFIKGTTTVGTNSVADTSPVACTGPSSIREFKFTVDSKDTEWKVGDAITAGFAFWMVSPPEAAAKNVHVLVASTKHPSSITALGLGAGDLVPAVEAPQIINETLTGTTATLSHAFTNATNATYHYNWTTDSANLSIDATGNLSAGSARIEILDGGQGQVFNETFDANLSKASARADLTAAVPGNWTIILELAGAIGNVTLTVGPPPPPPAPAPTSNATGPSNSTVATPEGEGIPAPAYAAGACVLFAAAAIRRRRA